MGEAKCLPMEERPADPLFKEVDEEPSARFEAVRESAKLFFKEE